MQFTPKEILGECSIDIKVSPIELNDEEDVTKKQLPDDWPDQNLIDSIQNGSKRYLSIPEHSEKHNQLTPDSGIGTDDGLPHFPHKEEDKQSINFSVTGSEYSPKVFDDIRFLQEIRNFPLSQKDDQCALKNEEDELSIDSSVTDSDAFDSEDSYDSRCDPLHFDYQNKSQVTRTNSSNWSSEEDSSCSSDYLLPEDSFLMKLEIPLTKSEKSLIDEFYQKMEEVEAQNDQERKENIYIILV